MRLSTCLSVLASVCVLNSCGGGGGGGASTTPPVPAATPMATSTLTTVDPSIPQSTASSISQVASLTGLGSVGSSIPVDLSGASGETFVFGVNSAGRIVVASMVTSDKTLFSADSTALALARLISADVQTSLPPSQIESEIRNASGYSSLVSLIDSDLQRGIPPTTDSSTVKSLIGVLNAAVPKFATGKRESNKSLALTQVTKLPYTVIPPLPGGAAGVQIISASPVPPQITLSDGSGIPWSATTCISGVNASADCTPNTTGVVILDGPKLLIDHQPAVDLGMYNAAFNLSLAQDGAAQFQTKVEATLDVLDGFALFLPASCTNSVLSPIVRATLKGFATQGVAWDTFLESWNEDLTLAPLTEIFNECGVSKLATPALALAVEAAASAAADVAGVGELAVFSGAAFQLGAAYAYWGRTETVSVCANSDYQVASCATGFVFTPASLILAPGASTSVFPSTTSVMDAATFAVVSATGATSAVPGDLQYFSTNESVASLTVDTGANGAPDPSLGFKVTAVGVGGAPAKISITDPSTGATTASALSVSVLWPQISPSTKTQTFLIGSMPALVGISLSDSNGNPVVVPQNVQWQQTSGATVLNPPNTYPFAGTSSWLIPADGVVPGPVTITASDPNGSPYGNNPATINIAYGTTTTTVTASPPAIDSTGGQLTLTASIATSTSGAGNAPTPSGEVTFSDAAGVLCSEVPLAPNGSADCSITLASAPINITATYADPTSAYLGSSGTVTVQVAAPGTCVPLAGATTCKVTIYSTPGIPGVLLQGALAAPVLATILGTNTDNGVTTTSQSNNNQLSADVYVNVPGMCTVSGGQTCGQETPYSYQVYSVDGKFSPSSYQSSVLWNYALAGCTYKTNLGGVYTGYTLTSDGMLTETYEMKVNENRSCSDGSTLVSSSDTVEKVSIQLTDGSGSASSTGSSSSVSANPTNPTQNITITASQCSGPNLSGACGPVTWKAEATQPPQFAGTGITVCTVNVPAGQQLLPQNCP